MVQHIGDWGLVAVWLGLAFVTTSYFIVVRRWWADLLGATIGFVFLSVALVLGVVTWRIMGWPLHGDIMVWRAVLYPLLATAIWCGGCVMIWAQFWAPRRKSRRDLRNERLHEAVRSGSGPGTDGGRDDVAGRL